MLFIHDVRYGFEPIVVEDLFGETLPWTALDERIERYFGDNMI
jgi:hypothetical protein